MVNSKKALVGLALCATAALAQFNAPENPVSMKNTEMQKQNRTLTHEMNYNSLTHAGMSIGAMESQAFPATIGLTFESQNFATSNDSSMLKNSSFFIPSITVGNPEHVAFSIYYGVTPLSSHGFLNDKSTLKDSLTLTLPMHRFGLSIATQTEDKTFRFAFNGDAFGGKSDYDETSDSGRAILGVEEVGFSMGSAPHELFSFDIGGYASGFMDSLFGTTMVNDAQIQQERMAELVLPRIKLSMNFGDTAYPVQSSFVHTYAKKNFVYATRNIDGPVFKDSVINHDAIVTDSISWHWKNRVHLDAVENKFQVNPGFELGYMHNRNKLMNPGADNHPLDYSDEHTGYKWETSSFRFGFGLDFLVFNFFDYWVEYGHSNMKLEMPGDSIALGAKEWEASTGMKVEDQKYNRFATGMEMGIHNIPNINFSETGELFFNLSFMTQEESGIDRSFYGSKQYEHFNAIAPETQDWRYTPYAGILHRVKTNDFTLGLRGTFMNRSMEALGRVHFVNQTHSFGEGTTDLKLKGPRFQLSFIYNLVDKK